MRNALSFDVEEYFHVEAFKSIVDVRDWDRFPSRVRPATERLLDILDAHGVTATFFVLGWVADHQPALVRAIQARGHEIACHSYAHRTIYSCDPRTFRQDVREAKRAIEDATGFLVVGYRAPTCSVVRETLWALEILAEEGFRYDSSIFPIHHDRYGIPDAPRAPHRIPLRSGGAMTEFPMSTLRVAGQNVPFCGGGYFRLLPYSLIRAALHRLNAHDRIPGIVYLHPWEVDTGQPRMRAGRITRFRHYVNLDGTARKLEALLQDFRFVPVGQVLREHGLVEATA